MKLRFSPAYVDEKNVLTDEGRKLREQYLSKNDLNASFFSMAQPILCVGIEKDNCPKPLLPLINELKDKGVVVELKDDSAGRQKADNKKAFDAAIIQAKVRQIEDGLERDHTLTAENHSAIVAGEMDVSFDATKLKNGKDVLKILHAVSKSIDSRIVLVIRTKEGFKGIDCAHPGTGVVNIRLSTIVRESAKIYAHFAETDAHIRNDKSAIEPDQLCELITISASKKAKLYLFSNFIRCPVPYILSITTYPDAGDGIVFMEARKALKKLNSIL